MTHEPVKLAIPGRCAVVYCWFCQDTEQLRITHIPADPEIQEVIRSCRKAVENREPCPACRQFMRDHCLFIALDQNEDRTGTVVAFPDSFVLEHIADENEGTKLTREILEKRYALIGWDLLEVMIADYLIDRNEEPTFVTMSAKSLQDYERRWKEWKKQTETKR